MQDASHIDYHTIKALAERSGLHLLEVYRLLQGERVKNPEAWSRLDQARLELAQQQERHAALRTQ
jgi:hypothetical protein